jgi:PIN domain nuclease of toxin-antitoxin system
MTDPPIVLDASAVLALLADEPGAEVVLAALPHAAVSAVNLSEVVVKLAERGVPADAIRAALEGLDLTTHPFGVEDAFAAGALRPGTTPLGLGDRACLALAARLGAEALTVDRDWAAVGAARVRVIR